MGHYAPCLYVLLYLKSRSRNNQLLLRIIAIARKRFRKFR